MNAKHFAKLAVLLLLLLAVMPSFPLLAQAPGSDALFTNPRRLGFGAIYDLAWSPDGKTLGVAAEGGVYLLPYSVATRELDRLHTRLLPMDQHTARSIAFRPDGAEIAVALDNGTVRLLNFQTGALNISLTGPVPIINKVAYSPDGRWVAFADADAVHIYDDKTDQLERTLPGHSALAFSPDSTLLASPSEGDMAGEYDHAVRVWDVQTGKEVNKLTGDGSTMRSVTFSPDGAQLLAGGDSGEVFRWSLEAGNNLTTTYQIDFRTPQDLDLYNSLTQEIINDPADPRLTAALIKADEYAVGLSIWNISTGAQDMTHVFQTRIASVAFQPGGGVVAVGGETYFSLWDTAQQKEMMDIEDVGPRVVCCGDQNIYLSDDPRFIIWEQRVFDSHTGVQLGTWGTDGAVDSTAVSPDGTLVASHSYGMDSEFLEIFNIKATDTDVQVTKIVDINLTLRSYAFQADDSLVYLDEVNKNVTVLAPRSSVVAHVYPLPTDYQDWGVRLNPYLVTPNANGTLTFHDLTATTDYTLGQDGTFYFGNLALLKGLAWYGIGYRGALNLYSPTGNPSFLQKVDADTWQGTVFDSADNLRILGTYKLSNLPPDKSGVLLLRGLNETRLDQTLGPSVDRLYVNSAYPLAITATNDAAWIWDWGK